MVHERSKKDRIKDPYRGVKYRYVLDGETGQSVLLPQGQHKGLIGENPVFYDADQHKGHLVCPDCEQAQMIYVDGYKQLGNRITRGHFRLANGQKHPESCVSNLREDEKRDPYPDHKDYSKGPVVFINSMADEFNAKAGSRRKNGRSVLFDEDEEGVLRFRDQDLIDRERFSVKTIDDIFRLMKRLSVERLRDSKIIYGDSVTDWDRFMVRLPQKISVERRCASPFNRYISLSQDLLEQRFHPVIIHMDMAKKRAKDFQYGRQEFKQVALSQFVMSHDGRKINVQPLVKIFNRQSDKDNAEMHHSLERRGDVFVLGLPRMEQGRNRPDLYYMIFDNYSSSLFAERPIGDMARLVGSRISQKQHGNARVSAP